MEEPLAPEPPPHRVPTARGTDEELRRDLDHLLRWQARRAGLPPPDPVHALLLSDHREARKSARRRVASAAGDDQRVDHATALRLALASVERVTAPVTAASVRAVEDSEHPAFHARRALSRGLRRATFVLVGAALVSQSLGVGIATLEPAGEPRFWPALLRASALLAWGAAGASLYLLRRLFHHTRERTFDVELVAEYPARVVMGGVAGLVLSLAAFAVLSDVDAFHPASARDLTVLVVGSTGLAVWAGYSVRLVYRVVEKIVDALVARLDVGEA